VIFFDLIQAIGEPGSICTDAVTGLDQLTVTELSTLIKEA